MCGVIGFNVVECLLIGSVFEYIICYFFCDVFVVCNDVFDYKEEK